MGCYIDDRAIYLIDNEGVLVEQLSQWFIVIMLPITTLVFVWAGVGAARTHGCLEFDSVVLYLCAIYNLLFMWEHLVKCTTIGMFLKTFFSTGIILYLIYNFEELLSSLEKNNNEIKRRRQPSKGSIVNVLTLTTQQSITGPNEQERPRSCRPFFWISLTVLIAILIDATC